MLSMNLPDQAPWIWLAIAFAVLVPLAWLAWKHKIDSSNRFRTAGTICRVLGIAFIIFALTNPQRIRERPASGENVVAILADNSLGMRTKDPDSSLNRGERLKETLIGEESQWLSNLEELYQIRNYRFGSSLQRVANFGALDFTDEASSINSAIQETQQRLASAPLAAILVFSDGIATDPTLTESILENVPPIFPIISGSESQVPDLSIQTLEVQQSAFGDSKVQLHSRLRKTRLDDTEINARVERLTVGAQRVSDLNSSLVEQQNMSLEKEAQVTFEWVPQDGGIQFYKLSVSRNKTSDTDTIEETVLENNERIFVVDRGKESYRVLYITGRPNWEYKFLNRALMVDPQVSMVGLIRVAKREPNFEFKGRAGENSNSLYRGFGREDETERYDEAVLIRMNTKDELELRTGFPDTPETLFTYDAIIIDDLESDFFSFNQQTLIRDFVKQRGGGLLVLGGVNSLDDGGYRTSPIAEALPVYIDGRSHPTSPEPAAQWGLTREGWVEPWSRIRELESDEKIRLQNMPLLKVYNTLERIKPGASTLATLTDATTRSYPALVTRNFGSGRVATLAVGDLWRWGMQDAGSQEDLAQFWRQISRWLVKDNPKQVELNATQNGTSGVTLTAITRDKTFRSLQTGSAKVYIRQLSDGFESLDKSIDLELSMQAVPQKPGQFAIELPINESGAFHAHVEVVDSEGANIGGAETGWVNQPLVSEYASLSPNREYLNSIANATGGRVLDEESLGSIADELKKLPAPRMEVWSEPLWHNNWLFLCGLTCFLIEWLLRRKRGLA